MSNPVSNFFGYLGDHAGAITGIGSIAGAVSEANQISNLGDNVQKGLTQLGQELQTGSQFQGYGVSSGLGDSTVGTDGTINLGVGQDMNQANAGQLGLGSGLDYMNQAAGLDGGQSAMDWNAVAQNPIGLSRDINPNQGGFGQTSQNMLAQSNRLNPTTGTYGAASQDAMRRSLADPSQRQQEIFGQLMAIQNPELNRQQALQMAQEHAMGRGGVMGSQYGGTSGDAAMARARTQASNQAAISAMQQADNERKMFGNMASQYGQVGQQNYQNIASRENALNNAAGQFGQLGNQSYANMVDRENALGQLGAAYGQLGNQANSLTNDRAGMLSQLGNAMGQLGMDASKLSYLPMEMQMKLLDLGRTNSDLAQTGQLTGNDYFGQLALGGANSNMQAQKASSELLGNLYGALLNNAGGQQNADGSGTSGFFGMLTDFLKDI